MWNLNTIEWLDIELTSFCNIACKGCFREVSKYSDKILNKEFLSLDTIKERFKKEDFPSIKIINFCGSVDEPTSHPQFFKIIEYFADWNAHINIATNGSLRTAPWWAKLAGILPESHQVTWGIDGTDETSEVYRVGSKFIKVEQNYKAFIQAGGMATWQFIVFEHNEHQHELAKQKATDEGFTNFKTIYSHRTNSIDIKHKKVQVEETQGVECKYAAQKRIFINHHGNVIPCCHLNSEMLEYTAGRKENTQFTDILNSNGGSLSVNLKYNDIEDVIEGDTFNDIIDSWKSDTPLTKCFKTCKKRQHDKFIKETIK